MALLLTAAVGLGFFVLVGVGVLALRWSKRNRQQAAAMMTGTYLQEVTAGFAPPPTTSLADWLGDIIDRWCDGETHSGSDALTSVACEAWTDARHDACHDGGVCSQ